MDHDVASAINHLTAMEKAVLADFLRLTPPESGEIMAKTGHVPHADLGQNQIRLSADSN